MLRDAVTCNDQSRTPSATVVRNGAVLVTSWLGWITSLLLVSGVGCGRERSAAPEHKGRSVIVYCSVDDTYARQVAREFSVATGIGVELLTDTEETKSTGLVNRLVAEASDPQADVFWSGDPMRAALLKAKGVTASYRSPSANGLPTELADPDRQYMVFSARLRVIIVNTNLLTAAETPTSILDFIAPRFRGRACIANPLFGTTSMHATALFQVLGESKAQKLFDGLLQNDVRMLSSNGEVRRRVARGDFAFGLTDSDDVAVALRDRQPIGFVIPDQNGLGTLLVPNAVALISGAPRADLGRQFIDFLLSEATERLLASSDAAQLPLRPGVPLPSPFTTPLEQITKMQVDYAALAGEYDVLACGVLREWVERQCQ